jgi:ParB-like chromosome segregation protein Spo0J
VRASRLAGLTEIPASIGPSLNGSGKSERLTRALVANLQRADLNPIEEANAFDELHRCGLTVGDIARKLGTNQTRISNRLELLKLDGDIQALIAAGRLSKDPHVADSLLAIPDSAARVQLAHALAGRNASVKTCVMAAETLARTLSESASLPKEDIPSLGLAQSQLKQPLSLPRWDVLAQLGRLPPWPAVVESAHRTCEDCSLRPIASEKTCRDCPAVELIRNMILQEKAHA